MKLFATLSTIASASHYRGGTYQFTPDNVGNMAVTVTQTWRSDFAGYNRKFSFFFPNPYDH